MERTCSSRFHFSRNGAIALICQSSISRSQQENFPWISSFNIAVNLLGFAGFVPFVKIVSKSFSISVSVHFTYRRLSMRSMPGV